MNDRHAMTTFACARRFTAWPSKRRQAGRRGAFTMIELIVVMVIILIILGLVLPAARDMWNERRLSQAENTLQGLLMSARANALKAGGVETGMLFYIDNRGVQRIVSIRRVDSAEPRMQNVFVATEDRTHDMPPPMRVVPRAVVDNAGDPFVTYSDEELANQDFFDPPGAVNQAQRHRNFFTMIYTSHGNLTVRRDVLIQDVDVDEDKIGDVTGLGVHYAPGDPPEPTVEEYWKQDDTKARIDPTAANRGVLYLVADADDVAYNFPSVDGLMVYDDSLLTGLDTAAERREFLLRSGQPFYVNRLTGTVIKGPVGESPTS